MSESLSKILVYGVGLACLPVWEIPVLDTRGADTFLGRGAAIAQLIPDNTLGVESSVVSPDSSDSDDLIIEGGALRGENLFHSFEQFNIEAGQQVYFSNPADVSTILSRVIGDSPSGILGTLGIRGEADLFFLNPNGITFGAESLLDVSGSAIFSSAERILFEDSVAFGVETVQNAPLLTVSAPVGLQYGDSAGGLRLEGAGHLLDLDFSDSTARVVRDGRPAGISVQAGNTLALIGGDVDLVGGNATAIDGYLELGGVAPNSNVALARSGSRWVVGYEAVETFQDVRLAEDSSLDASGMGGVQVVGRRIAVTDGSAVIANTFGEQNSVQGTGDLIVTASESVEITGFSESFDSGLIAQSEPDALAQGRRLAVTTGNLLVGDEARIDVGNFGSGDGGSIDVDAQTVQAQGGVRIVAGTVSEGSGGDVAIRAAEIELQEDSFISTTTFDRGNGGEVLLQARNLSVTSGARITASTFGPGDGGNLTINAETVELSGISEVTQVPSLLFTISEQNTSESVGNAGDLIINSDLVVIQEGGLVSAETIGNGAGGEVRIRARQLQVLAGGQISASTSGRGAGGNIDIEARQVEIASGSAMNGLFSRLLTSSVSGAPDAGDAGGIRLTADELLVRDAGVIVAGTTSVGSAGDITIKSNRVQIREDALISSDTFGLGAGGNVEIQAQQLKASSGGLVAASTFGVGDGGSLSIEAGQIELRGISQINALGSGLLTNSEAAEAVEGGDAGDLLVRSERLFVRDGATISATTVGDGNGGNIDISSPFLLLNEGNIRAQSGLGDGGNIDIQVDDVLLLRELSEISSTAGNAMAGGNGGDVRVEADFIVAPFDEDSDITANAFEGMGGNIVLDAQSVLGIEARDGLTDESDITASSELGQEGAIAINTPEIEPTTDAADLPSDLADASDQIGQSLCAGEGSEFTASGRGGVPASPNGTLGGTTTWEDWFIAEGLSETSAKATSVMSEVVESEAIIEAQGWGTDESGSVVLTALTDSAVPTGALSETASCRKVREQLAR